MSAWMPLRKAVSCLLAVVFLSAAAQSQQPTEPAPAAQVPEANAPFPPITADAQKRLDYILSNWETSSQETKLLSCNFTRWHYDLGSAPAGVHATWAQGSIKYAAPDKGMFRVDVLKAFHGMKENQPVYEADPKNVGEYWVSNGSELLEFDRVRKECKVRVIPTEMRGQKIFESPLPFVFNLKAVEIQQRYWVREVQPPAGKRDVFVIEAWPKHQQDRAQYRFVKIVISASTFLPEALIMYAPNFDPTTAPVWDHYEFNSVSRNGVIANLQQFMDSFIKARPPSDWTVIRENFVAPPQQAATPPPNPVR